MHRIALRLTAACAALALPVCGLFKKSTRQARRFSRSACSSLMYSRRLFLGMLGGSLAGWLLPSAGYTRLTVGESNPTPRYTSTESIADFNANIASNQNFLSNRTISGVRLNGTREDTNDGVHIENRIVKNLVLHNVEMKFALFKNVTFIDCQFIKVDFNYSTFDNVRFIRGKIYGYAQEDYKKYATSMRGIRITKVAFAGVKFGRSVSISLKSNDGGIVIMRNIDAALEPEKNYWLLAGYNLHVRMDNCKVENQAALSITGENSTAYITNSSFINAELDMDGKAAWIENCVLQQTLTPAMAAVVIKKVHPVKEYLAS